MKRPGRARSSRERLFTGLLENSENDKEITRHPILVDQKLKFPPRLPSIDCTSVLCFDTSNIFFLSLSEIGSFLDCFFFPSAFCADTDYILFNALSIFYCPLQSRLETIALFSIMVHCFTCLFLLAQFTCSLATIKYANTTGVIKCKTDVECGTYGSCAQPHAGSEISVCVCEPPYINVLDGNMPYPCSYFGVSQVQGLVASFVGGFFGVDWFMLSRGTNPSFILCGFSKLFTFGGFGVWWLYDFLRMLSGGMYDGNGMPLYQDTTQHYSTGLD